MLRVSLPIVLALAAPAAAQTPGPAPATTAPAGEESAAGDAAPEGTAAAEASEPDAAEAAPATETPAEAPAAPPRPAYPVLVTATPEVSVTDADGNLLGTTPLTASLPVGTWRLTLTPPQGQAVAVFVTVLGEDAANRVLVDVTGQRVVAQEGSVRADVDAGGAPLPVEAPVAEVPARDRACPAGKPCVTAGSLAVWPKLRVRGGYELQQPDPNVLFIGYNDGFRLDQARFGFDAAWKSSFRARITLDAATFFPGHERNQPVQPLLGSVIDAYMHYAPIKYVGVWVGQTFMPADHEGTTSRADMNFTDRSVASGGVRVGRGYEVPGLSPTREIGIVVGARDARVGPVSLDYVLGVSNGNGTAIFGNDNKLPAGYARLGVGWERHVVFGIGGEYNPRTAGTVPNLYDETDVQGFADLRVDLFGIDFLAQVIGRQTTFDSLFPAVTDPNRAAFAYGATAWLVVDEPFGLPMFGLKPGYRVSFYDPSTSFTDDQLFENTFSMRYDPTAYDLPIALIVDVTIMAEIDAAGLRPLDNNRVVGLLQFDL